MQPEPGSSMGPLERVTVGLPVYNDPVGLRTSIPTVFEQSWAGDVRLVVIDDGSDDGTPEVLKEFQDVYGRMEIIRNATNRGRPYARNQVLEAAGDDTLAWIDSDDLWLPRKLEFQVAALEAELALGSDQVLCTSPFRWVYTDREQQRLKVPEIDGDQLYNALSGSLYPYLWAMLGPASAFRNVGGFDERLPRRQDYEFLVRFLKAGGRVISTDPSVPLCTYMKTDVGRSAGEIAAANEVIRVKHQDVYRQYGRRFELEGRKKLHLLVARFQEHNGEPVRSRLTKVRAHLLDPMIWVDGPRDVLPAAKRSYWAARRGYFRVRRVLKRFQRRRVRRWRDRAVTWRSQLVRVRHRLRQPNDVPHAWSQVAQWRRDHPLPQVLARTDDLLAGADPDARTTVWLRLEQAYRKGGNLWSAQEVLEHALLRSPERAELRLRLVELLSLRRDWLTCVEQWRSLYESDLLNAGAITHTRVSRAYRQLESFDEASEVAAKGLARFPDDPRLLEEFAKARAVTTSWLEASSPREDQTAAIPVGTVTEFGFLVGESTPIRGHLHRDDGSRRTITMSLNGSAIAWTEAAPTPQGQLRFALSCGQLGEFLGDGDVLSLARDDDPIAFGSHGTGLEFHPGFPSRSAQVVDRVASGHMFNKFGQLRGGNTLGRKRAIMDLFDGVRELLGHTTGLECYPFYGNLLGAIREHDFLPHDIGGFDAGYLASSREPGEVRSEFLSICEHLLAGGYHLTLEPWSVMIRRRHGDATFIDLNYAWVGEDGGLRLSYGWRYSPVTDIERFRAERWGVVGDRKVRVPGNAESVLGQIYGSGWLTPDQGFQLEVGLQRDERYLLQPEEMERLHDKDADRVRIRTPREVEEE